MKRKSCLTIVILIFNIFYTVALPQSEGMIPGIHQPVKNMFDELVNRKNLRSTTIGISILSLNQSSRSIYSYNAEKSMTPASCMKLVTSAAALDYLGPNFRYETNVYYKGIIKPNGTLHGDLILYGTGDPSLTDRYPPYRITYAFEYLADQLVKLGIKSIDGNIIGDGTYFDEQEIGYGWHKSYLYDWYATKVTALTFNDNCMNIIVTGSSKAGNPATVQLEPVTSYATLVNQTKTVGKGSALSIDYHRELGANNIRVFGNIPVRQKTKTMWISVDDPLIFSAHVFKEVLQSKGITVKGIPKAVRQPQISNVTTGQKSIATYTSPPLSELLKAVNKNSQNLYAELLLKTLGKIKYGNGSYDTGIRAIRDFMVKTGIHLDGYQQFDGSGLSEHNKITPYQLAKLMEYMYHHPLGKHYYDSMSIPGVDGSMRSRLNHLSSVMRGKTGGIRGVRTLTAYMTSKSGELYSLSVMFNDVKNSEAARLMEYALVEKLAQL